MAGFATAILPGQEALFTLPPLHPLYPIGGSRLKSVHSSALLPADSDLRQAQVSRTRRALPRTRRPHPRSLPNRLGWLRGILAARLVRGITSRGICADGPCPMEDRYGDQSTPNVLHRHRGETALDRGLLGIRCSDAAIRLARRNRPGCYRVGGRPAGPLPN